MRRKSRWLIDGSLASACPVSEALDLGATTVYVISTHTAPRLRPPRGAVAMAMAMAMAMNSVSLVATRLYQHQLRTARRKVATFGGSIWVVPSPEPQALSPFDFGRGRALALAAYQRTTQWLDARDSQHDETALGGADGPAPLCAQEERGQTERTH